MLCRLYVCSAIPDLIFYLTNASYSVPFSAVYRPDLLGCFPHPWRINSLDWQSIIYFSHYGGLVFFFSARSGFEGRFLGQDLQKKSDPRLPTRCGIVGIGK